MAEVKWIKLSVNMFEDEKIRLIEALPEADTILIIWIKLLAQAGKTNATGYIYLNEHIPYTDEMLATIFNRPIPIVRLALKAFEQFGMIEINDEHFISISNWEKHQNIEGMERIREQTRQRVAKYRQGKTNVTLPETLRNATDIEEDIDIDKEEDIDKKDKNLIPFSEIVSYLNEKANTNYKSSSKKTKELIKARWNEGFTIGDFKTVITKKSTEWLNDKSMCKYLRPETLFGTKFEGYLNQKGGVLGGTNQNSPSDEYNLPF